MPGWHHDNADWVDKAGLVCSTSFTPRSGVHKFCSDPCRGKWKYIVGTKTTESQYEKISGNWDKYFNRLSCRSQGRSGLSTEDLKDILEQQEGVCALSGIGLTCKLEKGVKCQTNASIDRIEAGGPYIKENVQLVCSVLNGFRSNTPLGEYIWWCTKVATYNNNLPEEGCQNGCE